LAEFNEEANEPAATMKCRILVYDLCKKFSNTGSYICDLCINI